MKVKKLLKQFMDERFPIRATSLDQFVGLAQQHAVSRLVGIPCGNTRGVIPTYLHTNCWTESAYVTFGGDLALVGHFQAVFRGERSEGRDLVYLHDYGHSDNPIYDFQFLDAVRKTMEQIQGRILGIETKLVYEDTSTRNALLGRYKGKRDLTVPQLETA